MSSYCDGLGCGNKEEDCFCHQQEQASSGNGELLALLKAAKDVQHWIENSFSDSDFDRDGAMAEVAAELNVAIYNYEKSTS